MCCIVGKRAVPVPSAGCRGPPLPLSPSSRCSSHLLWPLQASILAWLSAAAPRLGRTRARLTAHLEYHRGLCTGFMVSPVFAQSSPLLWAKRSVSSQGLRCWTSSPVREQPPVQGTCLCPLPRGEYVPGHFGAGCGHSTASPCGAGDHLADICDQSSPKACHPLPRSSIC